MTFEIRLTRRAKRDFQQLQDYLAVRSPRGAKAWIGAYAAACRSLIENPLACPLAPEDADHEIELRQFVFKTTKGRAYRGLFTVDGSVVYVLHLRGPGQDVVAPEDVWRAE